MIAMELYDACLKCNLCELHCPVMRVTPEFPGPKNGGPGYERMMAAGKPVDTTGLDLCCGCRTCEVVCPSGLSPVDLIAEHRAAKVREQGGLSFRDNFMCHQDRLVGMASTMPGLVNSMMGAGWVRSIMDSTVKVDRRRPMPKYTPGTFRAWFARRENPWKGQPAPNGQVAYFHGCSGQNQEQEVAKAAVLVLEHNGFEVVLPEQECCGVPLMANGALDEFKQRAAANVARLLPYAQKGLPIIFTSTSCSLNVKYEYPKALGTPEAQLVADHCYDISEFLMMLHGEGKLETDFHPVEEELPYHQPCHQRAQGIGIPAVRLVQLIPGVKAWNLDAGCCGIAGTYGFKKEKYDISMAVGAEMRDAILATKAARVICDCETCRWQIEHATGRTAVHPIRVLAEAYGLV